MADTERKEATIALLVIGKRIQAARKKSRMTVAKLSAKTAISARFIDYIEAGEFSKLPGRSHVLGFTRSICRELALDAEEVVQAIKSAMYPAPMTEFELAITQHMKRPLIEKIANAFKFVLSGITRSKQV
ncbi:helix-turn-helix transcriptional regulator [Sphingorhabdus sp. EL138]|uniref:helix-turn-helix domain-containing protein n=1 Tax=Sphingorhabdus sp. EL138 TaxID=2073156 RepID=UPI0025EEDDEF|nr:helix-turn-helix transcriptional regulator [Sphingorhabdus sp. EL138]